MLRLTGKDRAEKDLLDTCLLDFLCDLIGNLLIGLRKNDRFSILCAKEWMEDILDRTGACDSGSKRFDNRITIFYS